MKEIMEKEFIGWLEELNSRDSRARAVLKRSLAFDPGAFVPAFPYVEPFIKSEYDPWRCKMFYLVAGLWAMHWRERPESCVLSLGQACAAYQSASGSGSTERRFINLLDAADDQLVHRLRQMVAMLKDHPIDFGALLKDLSRWNDPQKRTQNIWARDFYRNMNIETETTSQEETIQ